MKFSEEKAQHLFDNGFRLFSRVSNLWLIPITYYSKIQVGEVIYCINGEKGTVISNNGNDCMLYMGDKNIKKLDNDTRSGLLAYGIFPVDVDAHPERLE